MFEVDTSLRQPFAAGHVLLAVKSVSRFLVDFWRGLPRFLGKFSEWIWTGRDPFVGDTSDESRDTVPEPLGWRLNRDILDCILRQLSTSDLYIAALVSREWAVATRIPLYAHILFDTNTPDAPLISETMRTCPHLRLLVRRVTLRIGTKPQDFDWLQLLPDDTVDQFHAFQRGRKDDLASSLFHAPFVRNVRHLKWRGLHLNCKHFQSCLALPRIESLSLFVKFGWNGEVDPISVPSRLTRLSLYLPIYNPVIPRILSTLGAQLQQFDLDGGSEPPNEEQVPDLLTTLAQHAICLRRLTIRSEFLPNVPYSHFDSIPLICPSLERLHLGPATWTPALFANLPTTLHTLLLDHHHELPFPFEATQPFVLGADRDKCHLRSLTIFLRGTELCDMSPYFRLGEFCHEYGVEFSLREWIRLY
ncbi:hypothetical protein OBBRIDRAFT_790878, partial [Obba rivulosa]